MGSNASDVGDGSPGGPTPDDFLGYTIARLAHVMQHRMEIALKREAGLSVRQFGVLAHLARDPGIGSGQLARLVLITPQSMGVLVDGLEARGLVMRDRSVVKGRRMETRLTALGEQALHQGYAVASRLSDEDRGRLTPDQSRHLNHQLLEILQRLLAA